MPPVGDPNYWQETHEPLNQELDKVVRGPWADRPPVEDVQLQLVPHYAGKHCLQSIRLSRLGNEGGAHAVALGLLRDAVEALSVVSLAISNHPRKIRLLSAWEEEKLTQGKLRQHLEADVWPGVTSTGLWGEPWADFWKNLAGAVQPYAHFSPLRMRWHQHIADCWQTDGKVKAIFCVNHPSGDFDLYRAARIVAFQLVLFWAFAEIILAFKSAPAVHLETLRTLADEARPWLCANEVFFKDEKWEVQLMPFVYPLDRRYWRGSGET